MSINSVSGLQLLILACVPLLAWLSYLALCWLIVRRTGKTDGLRDLAEAARAFRRPVINLRRARRDSDNR